MPRTKLKALIPWIEPTPIPRIEPAPEVLDMSDFDWSEQVVVKRRTPDEVVWDGIRLDDAVTRYMDLPPKKREGLTIFAQSNAYSGKQIEALSERLQANENGSAGSA